MFAFAAVYLACHAGFPMSVVSCTLGLTCTSALHKKKEQHLKPRMNRVPPNMHAETEIWCSRAKNKLNIKHTNTYTNRAEIIIQLLLYDTAQQHHRTSPTMLPPLRSLSSLFASSGGGDEIE